MTWPRYPAPPPFRAALWGRDGSKEEEVVVRWEGVPDCGWRKKKKATTTTTTTLRWQTHRAPIRHFGHGAQFPPCPIATRGMRERARRAAQWRLLFFFFPLVIVVSRAVIVVETKGHTHGYNGWIQHWCGRANRRKTDRATPSLSFHRAKRGNERNRVHKTARNSKCVDSIIQVRPWLGRSEIVRLQHWSTNVKMIIA